MNNIQTSDENNYPCGIKVYISKKKYAALKGILEKSYYRTMSELVRNILENKKITLEYYDATMDKIIRELAGIRKELQLMSINMNQTTNKLLTEQWPEFVVADAKEIADVYQRVELKILPILEIMNKIANLWLPK